MFSETKITEIYCMRMILAKNLLQQQGK